MKVKWENGIPSAPIYLLKRQNITVNIEIYLKTGP